MNSQGSGKLFLESQNVEGMLYEIVSFDPKTQTAHIKSGVGTTFPIYDFTKERMQKLGYKLVRRLPPEPEAASPQPNDED
jgi:hypothetical protein